MESSMWEFDAPNFVDFDADIRESADGRESSYFDRDHEFPCAEGTADEDFIHSDLPNDSPEKDNSTRKRLTFDTPRQTAPYTAPEELEQFNNVTVCKQNALAEKKTVEYKPNLKVNSVESPEKSVPTQSTVATIENKAENKSSNPLQKNLDERTISPCIPAKESVKKLRSTEKKTLRRSVRIANTAAAINDDEPPRKRRAKDSDQTARRLHPTKSATPVVLRRRTPTSDSMAKVRSSAQIELEEVERLKSEQKRRLKENSRYLKKALAGPQRPPSPAKFPASKAEYKQSDSGAKKGRLTSEIDFSKELRQYRVSKSPPKRTVVKPFSFSVKRKLEEPRLNPPGYKFNAQGKPNTDFRAGQRKRAAVTRKGPVKAFHGVTDAKTPKLLTKTRSRPVHVVSEKEKEELELEEIKKHQFKAKPVDHKILEGVSSLPDVEKRETTRPEEFHLHMDKRIKERPAPEKSTSPTREFKAHPVPKSVINGPVTTVKAHSEVTVAQSPNFKLKKRMEISNARKELIQLKAAEDKENVGPSTVNNLPSKNVMKKAPPPENHPTKIQPFSFDQSDKERFAKKEARIEAFQEAARQKASSFRATPIVYEPNPLEALPPKMTKPSTKVVPFHLESDVRGEAYLEKWNSQLEKEDEEMKSKTEFKANVEYQKILSKCGFKPVLGEKQNSEIEEFQLHTETRAAERHEFDERQKEREACIIQRAKDIEMEKQRVEEEAARKQRRDAVHKAAPIRKYAPVLIKESDRLPTVPQSPNFSDRFYKNNTQSGS